MVLPHTCLCCQYFILVLGMFLTICLPVGDWLIRVDLLGSFSLHVIETAMCVSQASAHWEGFPLPLTFRVTLEWVHNLLSTHFWLSWAYYVVNQAMLFPSFFTGCRELHMRWLCGLRQMCWSCRGKCHGSMSHLLYNLLFLLTYACLTLYVPFPFDHGILLCTSSLIIQQII